MEDTSLFNAGPCTVLVPYSYVGVLELRRPFLQFHSLLLIWTFFFFNFHFNAPINILLRLSNFHPFVGYKYTCLSMKRFSVFQTTLYGLPTSRRVPTCLIYMVNQIQSFRVENHFFSISILTMQLTLITIKTLRQQEAKSQFGRKNTRSQASRKVRIPLLGKPFF